jgi:hypothetical protein
MTPNVIVDDHPRATHKGDHNFAINAIASARVFEEGK